jgi:protein-tyrosine phosphatase
VNSAAPGVHYIETVPDDLPLAGVAAVAGHDQVLFVCAANICRSPFMEFLTATALRSSDVGREWRFVSAGTTARDGSEICTRGAAALRRTPGGPDFAETHRSRALTPEIVEEAALILVASAQERSAVARISLDARARTFTFVEAALLAQHAAERVGAPATAATHAASLSVPSLAEDLHRSRGTALGDSRPHRGWFGRGKPSRATAMDVGDAHMGEGSRHSAVFADLRWASEQLSKAVVRIGTH